MTVVNMPGRQGRSRNGGARIDTRNCYMTDAEAAACEKAVIAFERADSDHNLPAFVWWLIVAVASIGSFAAGIFLAIGSGA